MSNILDAIQQKLNTAAAVAARTEQKIEREATAARDAEAALAARCLALETARDDALTSLGQAHTAIETLQGRVDALVASLTQLGVDAGI